MPRRYFNWKLAIVLIIGLIVLGVTAFGLRKWRKTGRAEENFVLGTQAYEENRWEDAAEHLGKYIAVERDDVSAMLKYADAQLKIRPTKSNNIQQAIRAYRIILRVDNNNFEAAKQLAEIYLGIGSPGEAELIVRRQLETNREPELRRMLALAMAGQRKFNEAADELKTILRENPEHILAYETLGQLVEHRREDFPNDPLQWFNQAVEKNPSSALAYIVRAGFYQRSKKLPQALADLETAEKQDLSDPTVRLRLIRELINTNALEKAEKHLAAVQKITPADQSLWVAWAQLAMKSKSQEKMVTIAETGLKELSSQPWDFMLLATELYIRGGRINDANDCISKLLKKDIAPPSVAYLQGLLAAEQGNMFEAVKYWRQSKESGDNSPQVRLALALALSQLGNTQSAIWQLRGLVSENPSSFEGHFTLAKLLAQTGNWAEAAEHSVTAMNLSPESSEAALFNLRAQIQLLVTSSAGQEQVNNQMWQGLQKKLSVLEKTTESVGDIKLMQFQLALQQEQYAKAEALVTQLGNTNLSKVRIVMAEAELLVAQGKIAEAIQRLDATIEQFPEAVDLVRYLAILLDRQDNHERCEAVIQNAIARIEQPVAQRDLGLLLVQFYTRWEQREKAYPLLRTLAEKLPVDIPIKRRLLFCEQVTKDSELAQKLVDDIKSLEGENGWQWRYEQAKVWFVVDDFLFSVALEFQSDLANGIISEELRQEFEKNEAPLSQQATVSTEEAGNRWMITDKPKKYSVKKEQRRLDIYAINFENRYPQIVTLLQENILANPNDQTSRMLLAKSYERAGEQQLAISTYREALNLSPGDLRVIIPVIAALYNAKAYDEAEQVLKSASGQKLYHPQLQKLQLQSHLRHGQLDSASDIMEDFLSNDPNNQAACLSLALLKMQQDKFDESGELLAKLLIQDPDSLPVTAAKIQLDIRQGKPAEALSLCEKMVKSLNNASAYILRARTYALLGQTDGAIGDLERAADMEPDNVEVWIARSDFYYSVRQIDKATADIQKALSLASNNVQVQKRAISLYLASREPDRFREGRTLLEEALKSNPEDAELKLFKSRLLLAEGTAPAIQNAKQILQEITEDRPEISESWVLLGEIALKQNQPGRAVDAASLGLVHNPRDKALLLMKARAEAERSPVLAIPTLKLLHELDPNDVDAAIILANAYIKTGEAKKALNLLKKQLATCDDSTRKRCRIALAVVLYKNDNKGRAQNELDSLLESEPNDPSPFLALIQLLKDDKLWSILSQKVIDWYRKHPNDNQIPINVANGLIANGDSQAKQTAEEILQTILRNEPDSTKAMSALAILFEMTGRSVESAELYNRLLELEPDNLIAINNLAWIMSEKQGKHLQSLELAQRGLKIAPNYVDLIDTRGVVYYRLGEFDKAIQDFSKCIELYPSTAPSGAEARFHLARTYTKLGQNDKALEHLRQALDLESRIGGLSTTELTEAQRLLKQLQEGS